MKDFCILDLWRINRIQTDCEFWISS